MVLATVTLLIGVVILLSIVAANGYFVAQEFAYMSVDRARLSAQAEAGDAAAQRALKVTQRTSFMLSGAQLGITVTGLLIGELAEPLVGRAVGTLLGGVGIPAAVSIGVGTTLVLVLATVVQMIFGELYPKNLAIAAPDPLARRLARSTLVYLAVFGWLITIFDHAANALLRLLRIEPVHDLDTSVTAEELKQAVAESRESGDLPDDLSLLIDRVLDFPDRDVEHAMAPRAQVDAVPTDTTVGELRTLMGGAHSRYPVIDEEGYPVGIAHLADVLRHDTAQTVARIMREPLVVPTLMPLPEALAQLTTRREHLACVIDEYGGFAGVLTVEDLAEEVVGEITDEHDDAPAPGMVAESDGVWRASGDVPLDEVVRLIGHDLPSGDYETLAGLLIAHLGTLATPGETTRIPLPSDPADLASEHPQRRFVELEVLELARHVPSDLRLSLIEDADDEAGHGRDDGSPA
ncbi:MAG: hemolysin family protein [Janibacter sp.]